MRDLEDPVLFACMATFASAMSTLREYLLISDKTYYVRQQERWFLEAVSLYCDAVTRLAKDLAAAQPRSSGLLGLRNFLLAYTSSPVFGRLRDEAGRLQLALSSIRYVVFIRGLRVEVRPYAGEVDYSAEITRTFERFRQADSTAYKFTFRDSPEMNRVEAQVLDGVAALYPETFSNLSGFRRAWAGFLDPTIAAFDREVQFYLAYLGYIGPLRQAGLRFCYPTVTATDKQVFARECFDLALAAKLVRANSLPVTNDFYLRDPERIMVITGPNQGGKTTFARTFGQLHYLAALGCPVPGTQAQLYLADQIFTHFEREEHAEGLRGKLEDDVLRIHQILHEVTCKSILIINEIFSSATLRDALFLSQQIAGSVTDLDALCVWVTFLDELASLNEKAVSLVAAVAPDNPELRTFKIVRRPADGLAYAMALARKYGLTYEMIRERVHP